MQNASDNAVGTKTVHSCNIHKNKTLLLMRRNKTPQIKTTPHPTGRDVRSSIQYFVFLELYGHILIMAGRGVMLTMKEFGTFSLLVGK